MTFIEIADTILKLLTILSQVIIVVLLASIIFSKKSLFFKKIRSFFGKRAILFSFVVALVAMLGSLIYSEIAKYEPCLLCWYQRIAMYPNVIILGFALLQKTRVFPISTIALSAIGTIIAGLHYYEQLAPKELFSCSTVGYSSSCSEYFFLDYGYITIPMMALSAFILILFFSWSRGNE